MDVSDAKRTVDEAVEKMGGLDILVNTASGTKPSCCPFIACPFVSDALLCSQIQPTCSCQSRHGRVLSR